MLLVWFKVGLTEVVPTEGGERGGGVISNRYTVTTMLLVWFNVGLTEERGEGAYI